MDRLVVLYDKLKVLKSQGVKMKDIAEAIDFSPSVLSAISSTVLPTYMRQVELNISAEEALDYAISQVNNVSKKRLLENLDRVLSLLEQRNLSPVATSVSVPFLGYLTKETNHKSSVKGKVDGIYLSYSQSSASHTTLKVEPYQLSTSDDGRQIFVRRINTSQSMHEGFAILKEHKSLHIYFNESHDAFFAPVSLVLQLPFVEEYNMLKGLYLCMDVANNPIARRIVLKRISHSASLEEFEKVAPASLHTADLDDELKILADYLCTPQDALRTYSLPSRGCSPKDLIKEKQILSIIESV